MATRVSTLKQLFLDEIRDLYDAEKQLVKALPKMAKAATSQDLKQTFIDHLGETQGQVTRLEEIFEELGEKATGKKCAAMAGLIAEGQELIDNIEAGSVRDAGLIAAAQKVEHYEIAGYGSVSTHAGLLDLDNAVTALESTLEEEKTADSKLNELAESTINEDAAGTGYSDEKTLSAGGSGRK